MVNRKFLIIFTVIFSTLSLELLVFYPKILYVIVFLINIFLILTFYKYVKGDFFNKKSAVFLIPPILFVNSLISFFVIISNSFLVQFLIILNFLFLHYYARQYYRMEVLKIDNIKWTSFSSYVGFLIIFFSSSSVYSLNSLLSFPIWDLVIVMIFVLFLTLYQSFYYNNIEKKYSPLFIYILCFVLVEILWALFFLPYSSYVLGLIFTICYYVIIGIAKLFLKNSVNVKKIKFFLIFGIFCIFLVLLTAKIL